MGEILKKLFSRCIEGEKREKKTYQLIDNRSKMKSKIKNIIDRFIHIC